MMILNEMGVNRAIILLLAHAQYMFYYFSMLWSASNNPEILIKMKIGFFHLEVW